MQQQHNDNDDVIETTNYNPLQSQSLPPSSSTSSSSSRQVAVTTTASASTDTSNVLSTTTTTTSEGRVGVDTVSSSSLPSSLSVSKEKQPLPQSSSSTTTKTGTVLQHSKDQDATTATTTTVSQSTKVCQNDDDDDDIGNDGIDNNDDGWKNDDDDDRIMTDHGSELEPIVLTNSTTAIATPAPATATTTTTTTTNVPNERSDAAAAATARTTMTMTDVPAPIVGVVDDVLSSWRQQIDTKKVGPSSSSSTPTRRPSHQQPRDAMDGIMEYNVVPVVEDANNNDAAVATATKSSLNDNGNEQRQQQQEEEASELPSTSLETTATRQVNDDEGPFERMTTTTMTTAVTMEEQHNGNAANHLDATTIISTDSVVQEDHAVANDSVVDDDLNNEKDDMDRKHHRETSVSDETALQRQLDVPLAEANNEADDVVKQQPPSASSDGEGSNEGTDMDSTRFAVGDTDGGNAEQATAVMTDHSTAKLRPPSPEFTTTSSVQQQQDYALELERLREEHRTEIDNLTRQHKQQLQDAVESLNIECKSERQEMEQRYVNHIRNKEEQLHEVMRDNEGYQLKIDALKREVTGTQALLEQRDSAMGSVSASHNKSVELLEQKIQELKDAATVAKSETDRVKNELQSARSELDTSNEAYATLKARVKVVATELKERRVECRSLATSVADLKRTNGQLETQIVNLQSQLSDRDRIQTEKETERRQLGEKIESLELELHKASSALKDRDAVGEKALSAYKKKAQSALAVANARAAAANQAKEEAELEAATARTLSEEAVQRARVAETAGNKALAEAEEYVRDMVTEKEALENRLSQATEALEKTKADAEHYRNALDASQVAKEKLVKDIKLLTHGREEERSRNRSLQQQLEENQQKLELLYEEVESLREELRQATAAVPANSSGDNAEKEGRSGWTHPSRASDEIPDRLDAEGTIAMLEGELRDANRAIRELKDALKNAIAEQSSNGYGPTSGASPSSSSSMSVHRGGISRSAGSSSGPVGNEGTPLFFAMEKQAELNTARDEINRLANLLGDAESSKMEAYEAMDEMRRRMEAAEARLSRQEKFEGTAARPSATAASHNADDDNANLEYLKNIMLSYLNAKTLAERKALVPVIAAVLCLTPEEQAAALKNLDDSSGIEGVGKALFESFGGSMRR